jgi:hypothetical protein
MLGMTLRPLIAMKEGLLLPDKPGAPGLPGLNQFPPGQARLRRLARRAPAARLPPSGAA